jgi:hypothetical protein
MKFLLSTKLITHYSDYSHYLLLSGLVGAEVGAGGGARHV